MNQPPGTTTQPQSVLPRSSPPRAGAPEVSTWSTRSEASMNDVDTDKHRQTITDEEGHTQPTPTAATTTPAPITCIMPMSGRSLMPLRGRLPSPERRPVSG